MKKKGARNNVSSNLSGLDQESETTFLLQLEDAWVADRLSGNSESTMQLVDIEYQGGNSTGVSQTRADFIKSAESAARALVRHAQSDRAIKFRGNIAISTGTVTLYFDAGEHTFLYLRVYDKADGGWRLIASQSTPKLMQSS
jgi:hypothetical protein